MQATRTIGFVGTGLIAEAMINGFLRGSPDGLRILLSPRGRAVAHGLASRYPDSVRLATSNQGVVDESHMVFLCVRPDIASQVIQGLRFQATQQVVSVIAGLSVSTVKEMVAPAVDVTLAIPLPAMARASAPTVIFPGTDDVRGLFSRAGPVAEAKDAAAFVALAAVTAIMAPYFAFLGTAAQWLNDKGVAVDVGREYVVELTKGLTDALLEKPIGGFEALTSRFATPGSYNERLLHHLRAGGAFKVLGEGLDSAFVRMGRGETG